MSSPDPALDLYKLEYDKCCERYENVYKAVWTNFSYMAAVSAGILTFGKDKLGLETAGFLATLPLLFWWRATFVPLNRYGDHIAKRLWEIELALNAKYFGSGGGLSHFTDYRAARKETLSKRVGKSVSSVPSPSASTERRALKQFWFRARQAWEVLKEFGRFLWRSRRRVRTVVTLAFFALTAIAIVLGVRAYNSYASGGPSIVKSVKVEIGDAMNVTVSGSSLGKLKELLEVEGAEVTLSSDRGERRMRIGFSFMESE